MEHIHIVQEFKAPVDTIFNYLSDHYNFGSLFPGKTERIKDSADPQHINGLGSVRRITATPVMVEQTITAFEVNKYIEYQVLNEDAPVSTHIGKMKFSGDDKTCKLDYTIDLETKMAILSPLVKFFLQETLLIGLKKLAEKYE